MPAFGLALVDIPLDAWTGTRLDDEAHHVPLAASLCINELWERGTFFPSCAVISGARAEYQA